VSLGDEVSGFPPWLWQLLKGLLKRRWQAQLTQELNPNVLSSVHMCNGLRGNMGKPVEYLFFFTVNISPNPSGDCREEYSLPLGSPSSDGGAVAAVEEWHVEAVAEAGFPAAFDSFNKASLSPQSHLTWAERAFRIWRQ